VLAQRPPQQLLRCHTRGARQRRAWPCTLAADRQPGGGWGSCQPACRARHHNHHASPPPPRPTHAHTLTRMMPRMPCASPGACTGTLECPEARMASRVCSSSRSSVDSMNTCRGGGGDFGAQQGVAGGGGRPGASCTEAEAACGGRRAGAGWSERAGGWFRQSRGGSRGLRGARGRGPGARGLARRPRRPGLAAAAAPARRPTLSRGVMACAAVLLVRSSAPRMMLISSLDSVPPNPAFSLCRSTSALSCPRLRGRGQGRGRGRGRAAGRVHGCGLGARERRGWVGGRQARCARPGVGQLLTRPPAPQQHRAPACAGAAQAAADGREEGPPTPNPPTPDPPGLAPGARRHRRSTRQRAAGAQRSAAQLPSSPARRRPRPHLNSAEWSGPSSRSSSLLIG
jgi:hypothetical protein